MQIRPIFMAAVILLTAVPVAGQEVNQLQSGMRVRVTAMGGARSIGSLIRASADTIELRQPSAVSGRSTFEMRDVRKIEVSRSRRRGAGALKYAGLGFAGAGMAGALLGYGVGSGDGMFSRGEVAAGFGLAFGTVGFTVGLVAGVVQGAADRWEDISKHSIR